MITSNVLNHLDEYKILTDCQHGIKIKKDSSYGLYIEGPRLAERRLYKISWCGALLETPYRSDSQKGKYHAGIPETKPESQQ